MQTISGSCDTARRVASASLLRRHITAFDAFVSICARILLSVLRTLLHGAFQWLQQKNPVVQEALERGRVEAHGSARGALLGNPRLVGRAHGNPRRGGRASDLPPAKLEAGAAVGRVEEAVAVLVVDHSLPWLA